MIVVTMKKPDPIKVELKGVTIKKNAEVEPLTVVENGTYHAPKDGFNPVTVSVPDPPLQSKNTARNGTVVPDDGFYGLSEVDVAVPLPTGTMQITENGTHDVYDYAEAEVNVQPNLQDKTITENGTYSADEGYDGLDEVTVAIQQKIEYVHTGVNLFRGEELPENFDIYVPNIEDMSSMFNGANCTNVKVRTQKPIKGMNYIIQGSTVKIFDVTGIDTSNVPYFQFSFADTLNLEEIKGDLDFSSATSTYQTFGSIKKLKEVRFVPNSIHISLTFAFSWNYTPTLSNATLISVANGLNEDVTSQTIGIPQQQKPTMNTITGTVSLDPGGTYHIFTADENGNMTLTEFITEIKGWTIA